jgi:hypothetical protein
MTTNLIEMPNRRYCPDCGGSNIQEMEVTYQFPYGYHRVRITVSHLAGVCQDPACECIITDWRAHKAQNRSIAEYLLSTE